MVPEIAKIITSAFSFGATIILIDNSALALKLAPTRPTAPYFHRVIIVDIGCVFQEGLGVGGGLPIEVEAIVALLAV